MLIGSLETLFLHKGLKPALNHNYKLFTYDELVAEVEKVAKDAADIIGFSTENSKILLHHFKWDAVNLTEKFYEADSPKAFLKKSKILLFDEASHDVIFAVDKCYECEKVKEVVLLQCPHSMCIECWKDIVVSDYNIADNKEIIPSMNCLTDGCETAIRETFILQLFKSANTYQIYQKLIVNSFIALQPDFKWCPNRKNGCDKAVKVDADSKVEEITCECGFTFCFSCGDIPHSPFPCIFIKKMNVASIKYEADLSGQSACELCRRNVSDDPAIKRKACPACYCFTSSADQFLLKFHNPNLSAYHVQSIIFKNECQQLHELGEVKEDDDEKVVLFKLSLRCLHNLRQQMIPFYAFLHFLDKSQIGVFDLLLPGIEKSMKTATSLLALPFKNPLLKISEGQKMGILNALTSLKARVDSILKCYQDEEKLWKFTDREIEDSEGQY